MANYSLNVMQTAAVSRKQVVHKTHHKVLLVLGTMLSTCRSIMSLSKVTYQIRHNHQFSQKSKTTKRVGSGFVGCGDGGNGGIEKK